MCALYSYIDNNNPKYTTPYNEMAMGLVLEPTRFHKHGNKIAKIYPTINTIYLPCLSLTDTQKVNQVFSHVLRGQYLPAQSYG